MNERIKQLAEQAGLETQPAKLKIYKNDDGTVTSGGWEYPLEKFAELIMKECIRVPYDMWDKAELNADVAVKIEHRIREHFGVEL